jgi:isochorismate pyruvate lyase
VAEYRSLDETREQIDRVDREIVRLIAERSGYVRQVVRFKSSVDQAADPDRVRRVIANVRQLAGEHGVDPDLIEQVYRTLIAAFIAAERAALEKKSG